MGLIFSLCKPKNRRPPPELIPFSQFLKLPSKALRIVLHELDAHHIFELSQVSAELAALINPAHHTFDHIEVNISKEKKSISFYNNWQKDRPLTFNFTSKRAVFNRTVKFGDLRLPMKYDPKTRYHCSTDIYEECLQPCLDFFATIFSCRGGIAVVNMDECTMRVRQHTDHPIFKNNLVAKLSGNINPNEHVSLQSSIFPEYVLLEGIIVEFYFSIPLFDLTQLINP
ncbi:F-box domain-containing protein [Caenorhabditis elegans]|uniref:F-box domain-containing protein n=1 Tax=Caenorhabditis elegans TaxID=6239 RepID=A5JYZ3_CAEEL|nr:F-box domain-containing protein [Caenorhabditis elegans]CAN86927.1 F-box domain-containing protein [Caenorhabditis elegans]|eukprot:NP_001123011.1 Uncharacterized protein CELE_T10C6.10 [Caenorhabditis elegans]